jgi:hypothetical protein
MSTRTQEDASSPLPQIAAVVLALLVVAGIWFFTRGEAATEINLTLTTNPDLESGLVGHWTFDGPDVDWASTTAEIKDRSGNGYHGNATSSMTTESVTPGPLGQGMTLNESRLDSICLTYTACTVPGSSSGRIQLGTIHTASAWVRMRPIAIDSHVLGTNEFMTPLGVTDTGGDNFGLTYWASSLAANKLTFAANSLTLGVWHHLTTVRSGLNVTGYVNGVSVGTQTLGNNDSIGFDRIGVFGTTYFLDADLDDVRIYNRALSADEVKRLYELGATTRVAETLTENPDLETGLVGHWTFDGPDVDWSSTTAEIKDRSGNNNHGDAQGGMTAATSPTMGVLGQGMGFDGGDNKILIADNAILSDMPELSFFLWVNPRQISDSPFVLEKLSSYELRVNASGKIQCAIKTDGNPVWEFCDIISNSTIGLGTWSHIGLTYDGTTYTYYIDGQSSGSNSIQYSGDVFYSINPLSLPRATNMNDLNGSLDDVRIYNRALSAEEVKRLYELGATTRVAETLTENPDLETGLVGHWTFDGPDVDWSSTTAEIKDRSGNNNHGDAQGGMTAATSPTMGVMGQGMGFDGIPGNEIVLDNLPDLDMSQENALTITAWVYPTEPIASRTVFARGAVNAGAGSEVYYLATYLSGKRWRFGVGDGSATFYTLSGADTIDMDTWQHVAFTYGSISVAGTSIKLYKNGVLIKELETGPYSLWDGDIAFDRSTSIGSVGYSPGGEWPGALDDVRIYNRALSADEVRRLYDMGR